jgi:hypothetical protein
VVGLSIVLVSFTQLIAKEWSAEQKDVMKWFKKYTEVSVQGNVEEIMGFFHSNFSGWNYAYQLPFDKDFLRNLLDYSYKNNKLISFEVNPLEIQVEGNFAIAHVYFKEILRDSAGKDTIVSGRWTAALVKQDNKWVFISSSWGMELKPKEGDK